MKIKWLEISRENDICKFILIKYFAGIEFVLRCLVQLQLSKEN